MSGSGRKRGRPPKSFMPQSPALSNFLKKPKSTLLFAKSSSRSSTPSKELSKGISSGRGTGKRRGRGASSASSTFLSWNIEAESVKSTEGSLLPTSEDDGWSRSSEDDVVEESDSDDEVESGSNASVLSASVSMPIKSVGSTTEKEIEEEPPPLTLPPSSDDLIIPRGSVMSAMSVYEVLRHFRTIIRLSPFRFEDFCMALQSQEQSVLLSEIHMALLRCLIREEDKSNTYFGPQDIKDGLNTMLYFMDHVSWPQVLKQLFHSDQEFASGIDALMEDEYPFTSPENRLKVLVLLTDALLATNVIRDDITSEGAIHYDDHCRVCHRVGDLLCCETCSATFHLGCVDPPLEGIPTEDWICSVCEANLTPGVTDCMSDAEKVGIIYRQECLGTDRHFRKYYFIVRRIVVHSESDEMWYYSSKPQLDELMDSLDRKLWEADLIDALEEYREVIEKQMSTTETLSRDKGGSNKSYLECQNVKLLSLQRERAERRAKQEQEKREAAMRKTELDPIDTSEGNMASAESVVEDGTVEMDSSTTLLPESETHEGGIFTSKVLATNPGEANLFKLGMENSYKNWVNQYSVNALALNKSQHQEDRDRKRHMSHKFSLTPLSEFKWGGAVMGTKQLMIQTLRSTLSSLEGSIPQFLMHPVWPLQRNNWRRAVMMSNGFKEFALALGILESVIKPVLFNEVWHASLGHPPHLKRVTQAERDEKKKQEKKDKKEEEGKEQDLDRSKFVKFALGLKHNVWKQKGEEYRVAGGGGWYWYPATRSKRRVTSKANSLIAQRASTTASLTDIKNENPQIDVSGELIKNGLGLYSRVARRAKLDDLLYKRERLQAVEANQLKNVEAKVIASWPEAGAERLVLDFCACLSTTLQVGESEEGSKGDTVKEEGADAANVDDEEEAMEEEDVARGGTPESESTDISKEEEEEEEAKTFCYSALCRTSSTSHPCYSPLCPRKRRRRLPSEAERLFNKLGSGSNFKKKETEVPGPNGDEDVKPESGMKDEKLESTVLSRLPTHLVTTKLHHHGTSLNDIISSTIDKSVDAAKASDAKITVKIPALYSSSRYPVHILKHSMGQPKVVKKVKLYTKLPLRHQFTCHAGQKASILVLPKAEAKMLARRCGMREVAGFNYMAKMNPYAWPYPCPRPFFKTSWRYRLTQVRSVAGIAMQLRIFWAVIRWDDLGTKPPAGGTITITTDTEVTKKEVLKRRDTGDDGLRSEYLVRKIVIPINVSTPKKEKHISIRSGLRTRKREDSPEPREPSLTELWLPEEALELWEIRQFADKVNKVVASNPVSPSPKESSSSASSRPSPPTTPPVVVVTSATSVVPKSQSPEITKVQLEMQLRQQRAAMQLKRLNEKDSKKKNEAINVLTVNQMQETRPMVVKSSAQVPQVIRTADGKTIVIHNSTPAPPPSGAVIRAVTPQGAIINLPASLVSASARTQSPQTIKIVQSPAQLGATRRVITTAGVSPDIIGAQPQIIKISTQPKPTVNVAAPLPATVPPPAVPHIVTVNAEGNIQRIIQQPQQQSQVQPQQFQIVKTPSGVNQLILPSSTAPPQSVVAPTQLTIRQASPLSQMLPQAIRLPNGAMAIRITNPNIRSCFVPTSESPSTSGVASAAQTVRPPVQIVTQPQPAPPVIQSAPVQLPAAARPDPPPVPQLQLIQGPNGQLTVRGLQPGQQLIKLSDGRLVLTTANLKPQVPSTAVAPNLPNPQISSTATVPPISPEVSQTQTLSTSNTQNIVSTTPASTSTGAQSPLRVVGKLPGSTMTFSTTLEPSLLSPTSFKPSDAPPTDSVTIVEGDSVNSKVTACAEEARPIDPDVATTSDNAEAGPQTSSPTTVTAQMAQEVIKQALLNQKLAPSIHSKLVAFQKKQQEKTQSPPPLLSTAEAVSDQKPDTDSKPRNKAMEPLTSSESPSTPLPQPPSGHSKKISEDISPRKMEEEQRLSTVSTLLRSLVDRVEREELKEERRLAKERAAEERRRVAAAQRAAATLNRHKEALKREILKKRAALEKELDQQAHDEVALELREFLSRSSVIAPVFTGSNLPTSPLKIDPESPPVPVTNQRLASPIKRVPPTGFASPSHVTPSRLSHASAANYATPSKVSPTAAGANPMEKNSPPTSAKPAPMSSRSQVKSEAASAPARKRKNSSRSTGEGRKSRMLSTGPPKASKRLYCICKTPYDETKFYIGCDVCSDWFHGSCIGVTAAQAENMGEYVCDSCKPKDREELFCFCRTRYDNSLFYIGCDRCEDWFHGTCVNITEQEANKIDDYVCPRCLKTELSQQLSRDSRMQTHVLGSAEYNDLKKLIQTLKNHKMAWPFLQSGTDDTNVDLTTLEHHLIARRYSNLAAFFAEASLIFSSVRQRYSPASPHARCAALLEPVLISGIAAVLKKTTRTR